MILPATDFPFSERFPGFEFDWFAQDAEGNMGLFSTGGFGPVPLVVQRHFQDHDCAALGIALPHAGSLDVWQDVALHGLYVFDWHPHAGPYRKLKQPEGEMSAELHQLIQHIADLPTFNGAFRQVEGIAMGPGGELTTA
ncbi:hypothetical protein [Hymenobacter arizonensis]|uniref:Uncharacterized protein n=1 Tax=Hymenobacter arizonensis TaxID=1227077 RepID=A0A1I6BDC8_HYMAR|nr:hypothetical protein [Hymenobacter arizonensis]SFQ78958.1 hypothetical protein SAMN04515668_4382 [Hymenobacter arizonensis]